MNFLVRRGQRMAAFLFSLLFSAVICADDSPIRIGVIASYSGAFATYGDQFDKGIELFLQQHDHQIQGRPVEIIRKDTSGPNPDRARRAAQELVVRDKVHFIAGLDFSPNAFAVAPIASQAHTPTIVMNASSSGIPAASPYVVRVSFTVAQVSAPMAQWALQNGLKEAMVVVSDYDPGLDAEAAFSRVFEAGGGHISQRLHVPLSNPDFASYALRIKNESPESVFFFFPSGEMPLAFMKAIHNAGIENQNIRFIATGEATDDTYLPDTGDEMLGLITAHHYTYGAPSTETFIAEYQRLFAGDDRPGYFAVAAYDGMQAINQAVSQTKGDLTPDRIMEALYGMQIDSPRGPLQLRQEDGDVVQTVYIRKTERVNGQLLNVPFDQFDDVTDPGGHKSR